VNGRSIGAGRDVFRQLKDQIRPGRKPMDCIGIVVFEVAWPRRWGGYNDYTPCILFLMDILNADCEYKA
jgi:hypothetical protein